MFDVIMTIPLIEQKQSELLHEIHSIRQTFEQKIPELTAQIKLVEDNVASLLAVKDDVKSLVANGNKLVSTCATLQTSHDQLDNRARRNNVIFYGIVDEQKETWSESEEKVLSFCAQNISVQINPRRVEKAHRLGKYESTKQRPIIMNLSSYKDKERILAAGAKLKEPDYSIAEDYCHKIRFEKINCLVLP